MPSSHCLRVLSVCCAAGDYLSNALDSWNLLLAMDERFRDLGSQMKLGVFEENGSLTMLEPHHPWPHLLETMIEPHHHWAHLLAPTPHHGPK
jgi:hypothetical protein